MAKFIAFLVVCLGALGLFVGNQNTQAAGHSQVQGIDVSHYQGQINWEQVASDDVGFAFIKATGGITYIDPMFAQNWHGTRASGITRGAYHFYYGEDDPQKQADNFLNAVGSLKATDLPPVVDVEITDNVSKTELVNGVVTWLEAVEKATGRIPMVYSDLSFAQQYLQDPRLSKYPLWIADYNTSVGTLPSPWSHWTFWQYSQTGTISGIEGHVDMDKFNGNQHDFNGFIRQSRVDENSL